MKKRIAAIVLCVFCLLAIAGCSQSKPDAQTAQPTAAQETGDYLTTISGTYEELFPQLAKAEYRDLWIDATTPLVGAENAETATDTLLAMCMAEPYGPEASEKYAADPDSMAFNCYFRGGVDASSWTATPFPVWTRRAMRFSPIPITSSDEENENGFLFYQSDDADSGDFTYFAFSPDTMETTYHLEFRYAEDLSDLQSWFEGNYAYWNAAAIAVDYDQETMKNVIELFVTENLTEAE